MMASMSGSDARNEWTRPGLYEVAPGVYRIPLPLPNDGLTAVNAYAVVDGDDLALIDPGWGLTEARERLAEAEAMATASVSKAVSEGNVQALNYFIAQKYVEAMTQIGSSPNARLVLMPMETGGLVGTIAGIAELAKNATRQPD